MHQKNVDSAPTEHVGGEQSNGPWPDGVGEVAVGDEHTRPVEMADGSVQEKTVQVTQIRQFVRPDGSETDGYVVAFQHDDPTEVDG